MDALAGVSVGAAFGCTVSVSEPQADLSGEMGCALGAGAGAPAGIARGVFSSSLAGVSFFSSWTFDPQAGFGCGGASAGSLLVAVDAADGFEAAGDAALIGTFCDACVLDAEACGVTGAFFFGSGAGFSAWLSEADVDFDAAAGELGDWATGSLVDSFSDESGGVGVGVGFAVVVVGSVADAGAAALVSSAAWLLAVCVVGDGVAAGAGAAAGACCSGGCGVGCAAC